MKIYFSGSIRAGRGDSDFYFEIINCLKKYGTVLTVHIGDRSLSVLGEVGITDQEIYDRDMVWLKEGDVVVAEVTNPSLGVGYEIAKAEDFKPVLCLYREQEGKKLSGMISGNKKLRIATYKTIADMHKIIEAFFAEL